MWKKMRLKPFQQFGYINFKSICVSFNELKDTKTTTFKGKHEPSELSNSSNLLQEPIFLCSEDTKSLIVTFVEVLEELASKVKQKCCKKFSALIYNQNLREFYFRADN